MSAAPIAALGAIANPAALPPQLGAAAPALASGSFSQLLINGIDHVNQRVAHADAMVRAFALDDSIPVHQVTFALEEARLSLEMMMQVRGRLIEAYQHVMDMQL